jgi:hypothetical protein
MFNFFKAGRKYFDYNHEKDLDDLIFMLNNIVNDLRKIHDYAFKIKSYNPNQVYLLRNNIKSFNDIQKNILTFFKKYEQKSFLHDHPNFENFYIFIEDFLRQPMIYPFEELLKIFEKFYTQLSNWLRELEIKKSRMVS